MVVMESVWAVDGRGWMRVMWLWEEKKIRGDEIRGRRRSCTSGQRRRSQLVIAGAGAKLAPAKPDQAESTSRVAKAHNQTR